MNAVARLRQLGQSVWLDGLGRNLLKSGTLRHYIEAHGITGITGITSTHPQRPAFDDTIADAREAADVLQAIWRDTVDGWVSLAVPLDLRYHVESIVEWALRLHEQVDRRNVLIAVPGTGPGVLATEELIAAGVPVNVTLLFSGSQYRAAAEGYLRGLERRQRRGQSLAVSSVASVFVSRWDHVADPLLPAVWHERLGVAIAHQIYGIQMQLLTGRRWAALSAAGATPQRLLWASTRVQQVPLPATFYVGRLALPGTIDAVTEDTLLALTSSDHISVVGPAEVDCAGSIIAALARHGLDIDGLAESLQRDGAPGPVIGLLAVGRLAG
jgi:transaldolase